MRAGALGRAVGMGVVTRRVLAAPVVCAAAAEGRGYDYVVGRQPVDNEFTPALLFSGYY